MQPARTSSLHDKLSRESLSNSVSAETERGREPEWASERPIMGCGKFAAAYQRRGAPKTGCVTRVRKPHCGGLASASLVGGQATPPRTYPPQRKVAPQARHGYKCSLFATRETVGGEGDAKWPGLCLTPEWQTATPLTRTRRSAGMSRRPLGVPIRAAAIMPSPPPKKVWKFAQKFLMTGEGWPAILPVSNVTAPPLKGPDPPASSRSASTEPTPRAEVCSCRATVSCCSAWLPCPCRWDQVP